MVTTSGKAGRPAGMKVEGDLLRVHREAMGLSREDLAEAVGTTTRTLQRLENEGVVGMPLLKQICEILRVPVAAVLRPGLEAVRGALRAHGLAPGRAPTLIGREALVASVRDRVVSGGVVALVGPIGVGKTSLAQRVAEVLAPEFEAGVIWVAGDFNDPRLVLSDIARALGFEGPLQAAGPAGKRPGDTAFPDRTLTQRFSAHFWRRRRLLVLDDVVDAAQVAAFVADEPNPFVLVTTRFANVAESVAQEVVAVPPIDAASVRAILADGLATGRIRDGDPNLDKLVAILDGMPGLARAVNATFRRERLTTPASWLATLEARVVDGHPGAPQRDAAGYYEPLLAQLSTGARELFTAFGLFESEPAPLLWVAAAMGAPLDVARVAGSELLDAQLLNHDDDDDDGPWLGLATHPAAVARALLGARLPAVRARVTAAVHAELMRRRAIATPALAAYYLRHQSLFSLLRSGLAEGLGAPPDPLAIAGPDAVAVVEVDHERARLLLDIITAIQPLLCDGTVTDSAIWMGLGLVAARGLDDPKRRAHHYQFVGWWRLVHGKWTAQRELFEPAIAAMERAGDPLALATLRGFTGTVGVSLGSAQLVERAYAEAATYLHVASRPSIERCMALTSLTKLIVMGSPGAAPLLEAAALMDQASAELATLPLPHPLLPSLLSANAESLRRASGVENRAAFAEACRRLRDLLPEPWLKTALRAHAAFYEAPLVGDSREAELTNARQELFELACDCGPADTMRLLWFLASAAMYEIFSRTSPSARVTRFGIGGHGIAATEGMPVIIEACGNDLFLVLSARAVGALIDPPLLEVALRLGEQVTDGRLAAPALRMLKQLPTRAPA